ncbi:monocarboxylate transporter 7 [Biomphalaria glabrata]|nr:monocarboxylate transporter 7-like [Biomphalaria glabrata]KAI8773287.1 monocarboxylate transporter 7 [Biomphalaria glabrata]
MVLLCFNKLCLTPHRYNQSIWSYTNWECDNFLVLMSVLAIHLSGLMTIGFSFCHSSGSMAAVSAIFGLGFAAYNAMFTIVLCNLFGVDQLTSALGFAVFFRGTGVIIGPPVAGAVIDITGSFDKAFYVGGAFIVLGGLLHLMLLQPCTIVKTIKENRCNISHQQENNTVMPTV